MKLGESSNRTIVAMLIVAALALAFWILILSPKREEADKLGLQVDEAETSLAQHRAEIAEAEQARDQFPLDYQRLVVLGKAVPANDDVASLLVQINRLASRAGGSFQNINLSSGGGEAAPEPTGAAASPTEAEASLLPLGASIGPAGLGVMPYTVNLDGNFFEVADFIKGLDSLVRTNEGSVAVDGRLLTVDSFTLRADKLLGFPALEGSFSLTSYLTPPGQGITGGATPSVPTTSATPASATIGGTP